jgi:hypothetical protein
MIENFSRCQIRLVKDYIKPETGQRVYQLEAPLDDPPVNVLPVIGDALFNYRATLDHMMWALVRISGNEPNEQTQFPIFKDQSAFHSRRCKKMLEGVNPLIGQIIECYQPYMDIYPDGDILWELNKLNNIDKHRHLHVVTGQYKGTFHRNENDWQIWRDIQDRLFLNIGHVEKGTILAEIPKQYAHIKFEPTFELAFSENNEFAAGYRVSGTIVAIGCTVDDILDQFERLFFFRDSSALGRLWDAFSADPYFSRSQSAND